MFKISFVCSEIPEMVYQHPDQIIYSFIHAADIIETKTQLIPRFSTYIYGFIKYYLKSYSYIQNNEISKNEMK